MRGGLDRVDSRTKENSVIMRHITPSAIRAPFANYAHGVEIPAGARLLLCSGQLGVSPEDLVPEDAGAQAAICFANIEAILAEAGMTPENVVRLNAYVTDREYLPAYMKARDAWIHDPAPASTLMIVSGFATPAYKVEIEALAAAV